MIFYMNGYLWRVEFVSPDSDLLVDRTGTLTVATTDPTTHRIYLSNTLEGEFLIRVLVHELGHSVMVSYSLLDDIHRMVYPNHWIEAEEWVCNFIANYGWQIFTTAYLILGYEAIDILPNELERLIS